MVGFDVREQRSKYRRIRRHSKVPRIAICVASLALSVLLCVVVVVADVVVVVVDGSAIAHTRLLSENMLSRKS